jgi:hypothetical protein
LIITFSELNFKAPEKVGVEVVHNTIFGDYGFTSRRIKWNEAWRKPVYLSA